MATDLFVLVVCALPPNAIAGAMLGAVIVALGALYLVAVRGKFRGPRLDLDALEQPRAPPASDRAP